MDKQYRIIQFEQIINNIQSSIDICKECDFEEMGDNFEMVLNALEIDYDDFCTKSESEDKNDN